MTKKIELSDVVAVLIAFLAFLQGLFDWGLPWSPRVGVVIAVVALACLFVWVLFRLPPLRAFLKRWAMDHRDRGRVLARDDVGREDACEHSEEQPHDDRAPALARDVDDFAWRHAPIHRFTGAKNSIPSLRAHRRALVRTANATPPTRVARLTCGYGV